MAHEDIVPGSPQDWLRHAQSDLARARDLSDDILYEELCFHAQQAAEKALKGLLVAHDVAFPKTHNLRTLLDLLPKDTEIPKNIADAVILTDYAVMSRYSSATEPIDDDEYEEALHHAKSVVEWVTSALGESMGTKNQPSVS